MHYQANILVEINFKRKTNVCKYCNMTYQECNSLQLVDQSRKEESHLDGHTCILLPVLANFDKCAINNKSS